MIDLIFTTILKAFFASFSQEIKDGIQPLVDMTLRVYDRVLNGPLKPTPNKSHYTFNLRDISRIFQGHCIADRRECFEPVQIVRLWIHENKRVYGDRLIDDIDRNWLDKMLLDEGMKTFTLQEKQIMNSERLLYGDYMDGLDVDPRVYR